MGMKISELIMGTFIMGWEAGLWGDAEGIKIPVRSSGDIFYNMITTVYISSLFPLSRYKKLIN